MEKLKTLKTAMILCIENVSCECGFRSQSHIKTKFRNSLSNTNLTKLILISELSSPSEQFDFNSCYQVERDEVEEAEYRERTEQGDERKGATEQKTKDADAAQRDDH